MANGIKDTTFRDTCKFQHDTTFSLNFTLDTAKNDFYNLLSFIERKGEFSRLNSDHKVDSSTAVHVTLKKILCWEKFFDSPVEYWQLNNVFSISYFLVSARSSKEKNMELPSFRVTQLNFIDNKEMEVAATKIWEVHWGEPLLAWNVWFLVKGNRRIYILENYIPSYTAITQTYRDIIQNEWVNKNMR
jgi:hypothetical protein